MPTREELFGPRPPPRQGCAPSVIAKAETELGVPFPEELVRLYRHSDGVFDYDAQHWPVWPISEAVTATLSHRAVFDFPASRLAFGADPGGDPFCVDCGDDEPMTIFHWNLIDGEVETVEGDMATFLRTWTDIVDWPSPPALGSPKESPTDH